MVKNSHKQAGSAHIAIVVILVILLIGALGFIFWQKYIAKNTQQSHTSQSVGEDSNKTGTNERYVVLDDWGVKFKIDDRLSETSIGKIKSGSADSYLLFSERVESAFKNACPGYPGLSSGAGWNIVRAADKPRTDSNGDLLDMNGKLLNDTAIKGYFYSAGVTGVYCPSEYSNQTSDDNVNYSGDADAVLASIRTLELAE